MRAQRCALALVVLMLWPLIFAVTALVCGMFGLTAVADGASGIASLLFKLLLVLFTLVVALALFAADRNR